MPWLSPFKKFDLDSFPNTYVPLGQAQRHPSVIAENNRRASVATAASADATERGSIAPSKEKADKEGEKADSSDSDNLSTGNEGMTLESLRREIDQDVSASGHDSAYDRKSKVINKAIQDIGMGLYQWELFFLCGWGWMADNLILQLLATILPSLSSEFGVDSSTVRFTTLALFTGLCIGAVFWGSISDVIGRRPAFNLTLFITAVFTLAAGGSPNWLTVCGLFAALGLGVGGNLPVDGALFLEFLPFANGNLLTFLSIFWPFGQLVCSLVAWPFLTKYNCDPLPACNSVGPGEACCTRDSNMGWRYLVFTMGALIFAMFVSRFFLFHLFESPKFLLSRGRQREAVTAVRGIAYTNGKQTWLSEDILDAIGGKAENAAEGDKLSYAEIFRRQASKFSAERFKPLFSYKRLGINTVLVWFIWACIGMGYPLFNAFLVQYLKNVNPNAPPEPPSVTYRNYAITSVVGCPGSIIACYTVDIKYIGRRGTMAIATCLTGIFLFLFTISTNASFQLGFSCMVAFFQNIMYGVLYAYTPETFPAPNRGTGTGIASFLNRIGGLSAPLVAIYGATGDPKAPIYVSGALLLSAFVAMVGLPIETMGKQTI